jgi:N-acetylglucosamine-6-sulfatase
MSNTRRPSIAGSPSARLSGIAAALVAVLVVAASLGGPGSDAGSGAGSKQHQGSLANAAVVEQPNIVMFLTDDMSMKHLRQMPSTRKLVFARGTRFANYATNISLCCPARASLLTGKYAHNTGITGNEYPHGFYGFHHGDEASRTVAVALSEGAGYTTSLLGKYFNGYPWVNDSPGDGVDPTYVPPGWTRWAVPVKGQFRGRKYDINLDGRIVHKEGPRNYLGDFLMRRAVRQIRANDDGQGLAMLMSFYGPHRPEPVSPVERANDRLREQISGVRYPRTPDFNERDVSDKPRWVRAYPRLGPRARARIDRKYRRQLMSVASIDRHVRVVVRALRRTGQLDNTYLVFTSDHGIHLGAHRLPVGKNTAYTDDVNVPFAIAGPGIPEGRVVRRPVAPMDVAPTFAEMAGIALPWLHDGESVLPLARGGRRVPWRRWTLVQRGQLFETSARTHPEPMARGEMVAESKKPSYRGVVGRRWKYVRYETGEEEFYDHKEDPYEVDNLFASRMGRWTTAQRVALGEARQALRDLRGCEGVMDCRR